ncbi:hypothetical protein B566_EDAN007949 [Ephemera danica]|nr:hypothetical protein B566_EDAN007949 [Ephemera danica]
MAPSCPVYVIATAVAVLCTLLQPMVMQAEDACPEECECSSRLEVIPKRRSKAVTCSATSGAQLPARLGASVEVLRFTNNSLRRIDFFALRFSSLLDLELCCNGIHEITGSGRALPRLERLDLSANNLHIIQQYAFRDFPKLAILNLSLNGLHTISPEAFLLPGLRELDLSHNRLSVLRADYWKHMPNLEVLQLVHNALAAVPALVFTHSLRSLQLSNNRIVRVDDAAFDGINISGTLDLSGNALRRTPSAALKRLGRVDTLLLDDNQLRAITSEAVIGIAARVISISKQKHLRFIQRGGFKNLPELEDLKLRDNVALSYIPSGAISLVPRLRDLDLSGNSLLALEREFISTLPPIEHLNCRALAVPPAKLSWIAPAGTRLANNACTARLCVRDHALTIRFLHREDEGQYLCFARNSLGDTSPLETGLLEVSPSQQGQEHIRTQFEAYNQELNIRFLYI